MTSKTIVIFAHLFQRASNSPTDLSALQSSISALESCISALESRIKSADSSVPWELWLSGATAVVAVGLLMEYWVICREHRDDWDAFTLGIVRFADRPSTKKYVVELVSVSLITLGVFGEFAIGLKISFINSDLRQIDAQLRSKNAELRSKSGQLVALINERAQQLGKDAEDERKARLADAKKLETERVKRVELALSLLDREFTDQSGAINVLRRFANNVKVFFLYSKEKEPSGLAGQINFVLVRSGWGTWGRKDDKEFNRGVTIWLGVVEPRRPPPSASVDVRQRWAESVKRQKSVTREAANALQKELQSNRIDAVVPDPLRLDPDRLSPSEVSTCSVDTLLVEIGEKSNLAVENALRELGGRKVRFLKGTEIIGAVNWLEISETPPSNSKSPNDQK